jgi:hypothetical protein
MKRLIIFLTFALLVGNVYADFPSDIVTNRSQMFSLGVYDPFLKWARLVDDQVAGNTGTGEVFYVDSGVAAEGDGSSWTNAKNTLDEAINLCTANRGDVIYVAQGHSETMGAAADEVDVDISGITIIGIGNGDNRPLFNYTGTTTGVFAIGADDVTLYNLRFYATISDVNEAIEIEAGSARVTIQNCLFAAETEGTDEFLECIDGSGGAASDNLHVIDCEFRMAAGAANSAICMKDTDYAIIAGCVSHGDYAVANIENKTTASNHNLIYGNWLFNGTIGGDSGLGTTPCISMVATSTGMIAGNTLICNAATPNAAITGANMYITDNYYSETAAASGGPMWLTTDTAENIIGFNDSDNTTSTSSVTSNRDGSILERLEHINKYLETGTPGALVAPASTFSILDILGSDGSTTTGAVAGSLLGAIGTNETAANTPFSSSTVESDRDGSVLERLEFIGKYFETGTPGALVAPASTYSLLDILGSDGSTTTGAVAGSLLGAIGTNETSANTPFSSSTVQADADGSVLERLEYVQADTDAQDTDAEIGALGSTLVDNIQAAIDANSTQLVAILADTSAVDTQAEFGAFGSTLVDNIQAALDANSTDLTDILTDTSAVDTQAEFGAFGSTLIDNIQAALDANSLLVNWTAARAAILSEINLSAIGDKVVADLDANSTQLNLSAVGDKIVADLDANSVQSNLSLVGDKVQADMDANSILYWQPRVLSKEAAVNATTVNLFDVAGGPIEIISCYGFVTVALDSNAVSCDLFLDADSPGTDYDLTTAVVITSDAAGTRYVFDDTETEAVLTPCEGEDKGGAGQMQGWYVHEGMIEQTLTAININGKIKWYICYRPLASGVTVSVQ